MKKIATFLLLLIIVAKIFAQNDAYPTPTHQQNNQNKNLVTVGSTIFTAFVANEIRKSIKKYKAKKEVLSKQITPLYGGKYDEIHIKKRYQKVGRVLIDTKTRKIAAFTHYDSLQITPEVLSRSWSIDPLASKFPYMSPYAYVENNPIKFVDVDGKELVVAGTVDISIGVFFQAVKQVFGSEIAAEFGVSKNARGQEIITFPTGLLNNRKQQSKDFKSALKNLNSTGTRKVLDELVNAVNSTSNLPTKNFFEALTNEDDNQSSGRASLPVLGKIFDISDSEIGKLNNSSDVVINPASPGNKAESFTAFAITSINTVPRSQITGNQSTKGDFVESSSLTRPQALDFFKSIIIGNITATSNPKTKNQAQVEKRKVSTAVAKF